MKKFVLPLFSGLLVLSLVLGTFVTAKAAPGDDPSVTPVSGDIDFTTEVVAIASLPGIMELDGGMLAPVGFPDGEAQFGGNGVRVTGMDQGKATACFYLATSEINQGWGGKVGVWDGTKWALLATTITAQEDTNNTIACATITGSGTYAFIKYVTDPTLLPFDPVCDFEIEPYFWYYYNRDYPMFNLYFPDDLPVGTPVSWHVSRYSQPGSVFGDLDGSWTVQWGGSWLDVAELYADLEGDFEYATVYFYFPTCHAVFTFDQSTSVGVGSNFGEGGGGY